MYFRISILCIYSTAVQIKDSNFVPYLLITMLWTLLLLEKLLSLYGVETRYFGVIGADQINFKFSFSLI